MRRTKSLVCLCLVTLISVVPAQATLAPRSIPTVFEKLIKDPKLSNPAMVVLDGLTGEVVYEHNPISKRKPASLMKILSAGAVIENLDLASNFNTTISIKPEEKVIVIRGSMDPWISLNHKVARKMQRASLPHMGLSTLKAVKKANGGSLKKYKVIYSNMYSRDISNLKTFWAKRGFKPTIKSIKDVDTILVHGTLVASENSPSVSKILEFTLYWSDNLLAERLARLSARAAGYSFNEKGVEKVFKVLLSELQINSSKLVIDDASGLSRQNRITAGLMAELLFKMRKEEKFAAIYDLLPVGGVSGTLEDRFKKTAPGAVGLVRAKTGTLNGTVTMAGFVQSTDREYVFVVLADRIKRGYYAQKTARVAIDRILGRIAAPNLPIEIIPAL